MKTLFFLFFAATTLQAQSDSLWKEVHQKKYLGYTENIIYHDKRKRFVTSQIIDNQGKVLNEIHYKDGVKHGTMRGCYADATPYFRADYKDGVLNGSFMVWYKTGELRRKELYKRGVRKQGFCYDSTGVEVPFFEFQTLPQYAGGVWELQAYLRKGFTRKELGTTERMVAYSIELSIGTDSLAQIKNMRIPDPDFRAKMTQLIYKMPKWIPSTLDGATMEFPYKLMVIITNNTLYINELYREPLQAKPPQSRSQSAVRN